jgi:hypothetical protein
MRDLFLTVPYESENNKPNVNPLKTLRGSGEGEIYEIL